MLNIQKINNTNPVFVDKASTKKIGVNNSNVSLPEDLKPVKSENLQAYHPSFTAVKPADSNMALPSKSQQLKIVASKLDRNTQAVLKSLDEKGILDNKDSNDGSSVLENLYKMVKEPRIRGLDCGQILTEVITSIANPASISQKFGDIPDNVAKEIERETGTKFPETAYNVISSSCVAASIEFNLASRNPAEFARFALGLTGSDYSVNKVINMSDISNGFAEGLWMLKEFKTESSLSKDWNKLLVKIQPDRNAIVRARVQASYRDKGERSSLDVLMQSAILNLASQSSYDALIDERTGKFNPDKSGLTDFEKNYAEEIVFGSPKVSVVYQNIDENGYLIGYNCELSETKQHILKSLQLGHNVIIGYTHLDSDNKIDGGHEITITGYEPSADGNGMFICNDTDDGIDSLIKIPENKLLPLIHHAGISKEALNSQDEIVEPWREILDEFKKVI